MSFYHLVGYYLRQNLRVIGKRYWQLCMEHLRAALLPIFCKTTIVPRYAGHSSQGDFRVFSFVMFAQIAYELQVDICWLKEGVNYCKQQFSFSQYVYT